MTYMSIFVERHPSEASARAPYVTGAGREIFGSVDAYRWPHPLHKFANENGIAIDWVDNCWIRVCVNGSQLRSFLAYGNELTAMAAEAKSTDWYVINEEEF